jgi:hypothetical protein
VSLGGPIRHDQRVLLRRRRAGRRERGRNIDVTTVPRWVQEGLATADGSEDLSAGPTLDGGTFLGKVDLLPTAAQRWTFTANYTQDDADGEIPRPGIAGALVLPSAARLQEQESLGGTLLQTTVLSPNSIPRLEGALRPRRDRHQPRQERARRGRPPALPLRLHPDRRAASGGRAERDIDRLALGQSWNRIAGEHSFEAGWSSSTLP